MLNRFLRVSTVAALAALPTLGFAQSKFEGAITVRVGTSNEMTYLIRGDQIRIDVGGRGGAMGGYMLHDASDGSTKMVMPSQRMYMDAGALMAGARGRANAAAPKVDITMTGKKEMIAGHECEHIYVTDPDTQFDVCAAKDLGSFMMFNNPMGGRGRGVNVTGGWENSLGKEFFPLKVQRGSGETVYLVTKIEKKTLEPDLFAVPADFTKMDMGAMRRPPGK